MTCREIGRMPFFRSTDSEEREPGNGQKRADDLRKGDGSDSVELLEETDHDQQDHPGGEIPKNEHEEDPTQRGADRQRWLNSGDKS